MNYEANKHLFVDKMGKKLTLALFEETARTDTLVRPVFKLSDWKKVYIQLSDPTEYQVAMELVGDWEHWVAIRTNPTLARLYFDEWAKEVEVKLRSEGIGQLINGATKGNAVASKWLAEGEFVQRDKRTKKGKMEEKEISETLSARVKNDMERLGLSIVEGVK